MPPLYTPWVIPGRCLPYTHPEGYPGYEALGSLSGLLFPGYEALGSLSGLLFSVNAALGSLSGLLFPLRKALGSLFPPPWVRMGGLLLASFPPS